MLQVKLIPINRTMKSRCFGNGFAKLHVEEMPIFMEWFGVMMDFQVYVMANAAMGAGIQFYRSQNNAGSLEVLRCLAPPICLLWQVILTRGVSCHEGGGCIPAAFVQWNKEAWRAGVALIGIMFLYVSLFIRNLFLMTIFAPLAPLNLC